MFYSAQVTVQSPIQLEYFWIDKGCSIMNPMQPDQYYKDKWSKDCSVQMCKADGELYSRSMV